MKRKKSAKNAIVEGRSRKGASLRDELHAIRQSIGHLTLEWRPRKWLNTRFPQVNEVLGHRDKGIFYGCIMEIAGWESQGKTAIALALAAFAASEGAGVIWADLENSFDPEWAKIRGLDPEKIMLVQPYVGRFDGENSRKRLSTAQDLCHEVDRGIPIVAKRYDRMVVVIDSIAAMMSEGEEEAGLDGGNVATTMDLPKFLNRLLRRWTGVAQHHNILIILINQLRVNPMQRFGDPVYTMGGNAIRFFAHVRVRVKRAPVGILKDHGKTVGIQGIIVNKKNKSGSLEGSKVGFKLFHKGPLQFLPARDLEKKDDD